MKSCPEYKALIDLDAGVAPLEAADLGAHLQTCADCAAYRADAARTEHLLRALRRRLMTRDPLDDAFERLSVRSAASRRQLYWALALLAAAITTPFAAALRGPLPAPVSLLLVVVIAAGGMLVWAALREQSSFARFRERPQDFFATWTRDLAQRIRMTTGGAVLVSAWAIGFLAWAVLGAFPTYQRAVLLGVAFLLAFGALHTFFVELRDLKSELNLVREAGRD
jgi:predicted anti-sigma-YlaC factor YlaD